MSGEERIPSHSPPPHPSSSEENGKDENNTIRVLNTGVNKEGKKPEAKETSPPGGTEGGGGGKGESGEKSTCTMTMAQPPLNSKQSSCSSGVQKSSTKKRMVHNAVERRRKVKINNHIHTLANLLPNDEKKRWSKNDTLKKAVEYIGEIKAAQEKLMLGQLDEIQAAEFKRLKKRIKELEQKNTIYLKLLDIAGIPRDIDPKVVLANPEKYKSKIKPEMLAMDDKGDVILLQQNSNDSGGPDGCKKNSALTTTTTTTATKLESDVSGKTNGLPQQQQIVHQQQQQNGLYIMSPPLIPISVNCSTNGGNGLQEPLFAHAGATTTPGATAVTHMLSGGPIMSTSQSSSAIHQQQPQTTIMAPPVVNTLNIVQSGSTATMQPVLTINDQGIQVLQMVTHPPPPPQPQQVILNGPPPVTQNVLIAGGSCPQASTVTVTTGAHDAAGAGLFHHPRQLLSHPSTAGPFLQQVPGSPVRIMAPPGVQQMIPSAVNSNHHAAPSQSDLPSALMLPNGQIIPVMREPSLLYPNSAPISGSLLVTGNPPSSNILSANAAAAVPSTVSCSTALAGSPMTAIRDHMLPQMNPMLATAIHPRSQPVMLQPVINAVSMPSRTSSNSSSVSSLGERSLSTPATPAEPLANPMQGKAVIDTISSTGTKPSSKVKKPKKATGVKPAQRNSKQKSNAPVKSASAAPPEATKTPMLAEPILTDPEANSLLQNSPDTTTSASTIPLTVSAMAETLMDANTVVTIDNDGIEKSLSPLKSLSPSSQPPPSNPATDILAQATESIFASSISDISSSPNPNYYGSGGSNSSGGGNMDFNEDLNDKLPSTTVASSSARDVDGMSHFQSICSSSSRGESNRDAECIILDISEEGDGVEQNPGKGDDQQIEQQLPQNMTVLSGLVDDNPFQPGMQNGTSSTMVTSSTDGSSNPPPIMDDLVIQDTLLSNNPMSMVKTSDGKLKRSNDDDGNGLLAKKGRSGSLADLSSSVISAGVIPLYDSMDKMESASTANDSASCASSPNHSTAARLMSTATIASTTTSSSSSSVSFVSVPQLASSASSMGTPPLQPALSQPPCTGVFTGAMASFSMDTISNENSPLCSISPLLGSPNKSGDLPFALSSSSLSDEPHHGHSNHLFPEMNTTLPPHSLAQVPQLHTQSSSSSKPTSGMPPPGFGPVPSSCMSESMSSSPLHFRNPTYLQRMPNQREFNGLLQQPSPMDEKSQKQLPPHHHHHPLSYDRTGNAIMRPPMLPMGHHEMQIQPAASPGTMPSYIASSSSNHPLAHHNPPTPPFPSNSRLQFSPSHGQMMPPFSQAYPSLSPSTRPVSHHQTHHRMHHQALQRQPHPSAANINFTSQSLDPMSAGKKLSMHHHHQQQEHVAPMGQAPLQHPVLDPGIIAGGGSNHQPQQFHPPPIHRGHMSSRQSPLIASETGSGGSHNSVPSPKVIDVHGHSPLGGATNRVSSSTSNPSASPKSLVRNHSISPGGGGSGNLSTPPISPASSIPRKSPIVNVSTNDSLISYSNSHGFTQNDANSTSNLQKQQQQQPLSHSSASITSQTNSICTTRATISYSAESLIRGHPGAGSQPICATKEGGHQASHSNNANPFNQGSSVRVQHPEDGHHFGFPYFPFQQQQQPSLVAVDQNTTLSHPVASDGGLPPTALMQDNNSSSSTGHHKHHIPQANHNSRGLNKMPSPCEAKNSGGNTNQSLQQQQQQVQQGGIQSQPNFSFSLTHSSGSYPGDGVTDSLLHPPPPAQAAANMQPHHQDVHHSNMMRHNYLPMANYPLPPGPHGQVPATVPRLQHNANKEMPRPHPPPPVSFSCMPPFGTAATNQMANARQAVVAAGATIPRNSFITQNGVGGPMTAPPFTDIYPPPPPPLGSMFPASEKSVGGSNATGNSYKSRSLKHDGSSSTSSGKASKAKQASKKKQSQQQQQQQHYNVEEVNLSNSIFETGQSMTPFFTIPNLSPPRNEVPTYIPNTNSPLFNASQRNRSGNLAPPPPPSLGSSSTAAAAGGVQQAKSSSDATSAAATAPYNPLFPSSRTHQSSSLNLNFQAPGFGMNHHHHHLHGNTSMSNQQGNMSSSAPPPHIPNFNLSNIFPDINSMNEPSSLNMSPIKFHHHGNHILAPPPPPTGPGQPPNMEHHHPALQHHHHHHQSTGGPLYHHNKPPNHPQTSTAATPNPPPPPPVIHNGMTINSLLGHNPHGFDGRPPQVPTMAAIGNTITPPFHGHTTPFTNVIPALNFSMHDH